MLSLPVPHGAGNPIEPGNQRAAGVQGAFELPAALPGCWGPHLVRIPEASGWEAQAGLHIPDIALHRITPGALKTTAAQVTAC